MHKLAEDEERPPPSHLDERILDPDAPYGTGIFTLTPGQPPQCRYLELPGKNGVSCPDETVVFFSLLRHLLLLAWHLFLIASCYY